MTDIDEILHANVERAAGLVEYQDKAVVSRTIINKQTGNVTLFAFDRGQGLSEHTTPFDALVHVLDGKAEVTIGRKTHVVDAGHMIIMPANRPHSLHAPEPFKMALIMIKA